MPDFISAILHLDTTLASLIGSVGTWIYVILFSIIFAETGLVIAPFLPGDSLVFAAGTFAATGALNPVVLMVLLSIAAVLGDTFNYYIGRKIGDAVVRKGKLFGVPIKKEYLERTQSFYQKNGAKTIVFARFIPILRTFAPFVAGVGKMEYSKFAFYNITSGIGWVCMFVLGGYYFGNIPLIKDNFTVAIFAVIILSFIPGVVGFMKSKK